MNSDANLSKKFLWARMHFTVLWSLIKFAHWKVVSKTNIHLKTINTNLYIISITSLIIFPASDQLREILSRFYVLICGFDVYQEIAIIPQCAAEHGKKGKHETALYSIIVLQVASLRMMPKTTS